MKIYTNGNSFVIERSPGSLVVLPRSGRYQVETVVDSIYLYSTDASDNGQLYAIVKHVPYNEIQDQAGDPLGANVMAVASAILDIVNTSGGGGGGIGALLL